MKDCSDPRTGRALIRLQQGDADKALADLNAAIKCNPKYQIAYAARGQAFENKGDTARALADYRQALKLKLRPKDHADKEAQDMARAAVGRLAP